MDSSKNLVTLQAAILFILKQIFLNFVIQVLSDSISGKTSQ